MKTLPYHRIFNGTRFFHHQEKREFTKVGNAYAIDDKGNEHILGVYDRCTPLQFIPVEGLDKHLVFLHGLAQVV